MLTFAEISALTEKTVATVDLRNEPKELYDPIHYIFSIGGKRIRPKLCLTCYNLFADRFDEHILRPAMALEIFHAFTLIHDDIMDKADRRRGHLTVHKKWCDNIAILSGDVMSIKAYEYLAAAPKDCLPQVLALFNCTAAQVCEGQQYDMNFEDLPIISIEEYTQMIALKTAVLLACSAKMGALIAGCDAQTADALYRWGYDLGLAFQITDDYLDSFGDPKTFGKNIGGDITNNKKSWLLIESLRIASPEDRQEIEKIMALDEANAAEKIERMLAMYRKLNIHTNARQAIVHYYDSAMAALQEAQLNTDQIKLLDQFAQNLIKREK
jgi:geranylgeranyl diphosphate synthase type II